MKARLAFAIFSLILVAASASAVPDQPYMRAALADLKTARRELQKADPDKGGHRAKAIALVNNAITEVNAGMRYDRRHNHAENVAAPLAVMTDQPHMQTALTALESAKNNLNLATSDKGGHRGKAIDLVIGAINQVKASIDFAR